MTLDEAIKRYVDNADYERAHGNLQGCLEFKQLVKWLKELKQLRKQEPCEDAVSREDVIKAVDHHTFDTDDGLCLGEDISIILEELPPVKPVRKKGEWIDIMVGGMLAQVCDQCNTFYPLAYTGGGHKYCPNCGSFMMESEEE